MSGPMIFIVIGVVFAIASLISYLWQEGVFDDLVYGLKERLSEVRSHKEEELQMTPIQRNPVGYRSGPRSFTEQMDDLPPDTFLTICDPETGKVAKLQTVTMETLCGMRQYHGSSQWQKSGDDWPAVLCKADPTWSRTEVLIIQTSTQGYLFKTRIALGPEDAARFQPAAQEFARKGQVSDAIPMEYEEEQYGIQDIGIWVVESSDDEPHVPEGVMARWILAKNASGKAVLVEDVKAGNDSVWVGYACDLDSIVKDILSNRG